MPLRPELYPVDWDEISYLVRDANDWQCAACGQQCRRPGEPFDTQRRTLTVSHFDHTYEADSVFLVPLCCPCHLRHDAMDAWRIRRRHMHIRQRDAGQLALLPLHRPAATPADVAELAAAWPNWEYLEGLEA